MKDWFFNLEESTNMSGKIDKRGLEALNEIAEEASLNHFHNRNMLFLEACIAAMLDVHDAHDVADILREHADQVEEYY